MKEEAPVVVTSPVPAVDEPYKINITVSKDAVKPADVKAPPPPQADLPIEEPVP